MWKENRGWRYYGLCTLYFGQKWWFKLKCLIMNASFPMKKQTLCTNYHTVYTRNFLYTRWFWWCHFSLFDVFFTVHAAMYGLHFYVSQKTAHLEKAGPASGRWSQAPKYGLKYPFTFKRKFMRKIMEIYWSKCVGTTVIVNSVTNKKNTFALTITAVNMIFLMETKVDIY